MTHKHEWEYRSDGGSAEWWGCGCGEQLVPSEVTNHLNATEELSAEVADFLVGYWTTRQWFGSAEELQNAIDALRAYAERMDRSVAAK